MYLMVGSLDGRCHHLEEMPHVDALNGEDAGDGEVHRAG